MMRAAKAQASLCIGAFGVLKCDITKFPIFFLTFNANSESSGGAMQWQKLD